jgi:hypothetical protein
LTDRVITNQARPGEPAFWDYRWTDVQLFFDLLAHIKCSSSPVFPSKLGHFIFPRLFLILDNEATNVQRYDLYWTAMCQAWLHFHQRDDAKRILRTHIEMHASRPLHEAFPLGIKTIELCSIGRKYRGITEKRKQNSTVQQTSIMLDTGKNSRFKGVIRSTGKSTVDGLEGLTIDLRKADATGLPFIDKSARAITLLIGKRAYQGKLRTTQDYVYVPAPLIDETNQKTTLARVFRKQGFQKNQPICLNIENDGLRLLPLK